SERVVKVATGSTGGIPRAWSSRLDASGKRSRIRSRRLLRLLLLLCLIVRNLLFQIRLLLLKGSDQIGTLLGQIRQCFSKSFFGGDSFRFLRIQLRGELFTLSQQIRNKG